jgi:beta-lactamase regulating signal transducer with metallopeptidase domain
VPSYLRYEPEMALERIGLACVAAALAGVWVCASGVARGFRAATRSSRYLKACESARQTEAPVLLLAGVFRPRLVVSRGVREALTADQLAVAVCHEEAHGASRDNLKRLAILMTPDALPLVRCLREVERGWARMAEWAADDHAVGASRRRAVALAEALVRVARMGAGLPAQALVTNLVGDPADLAARVERLIEPRTAAAPEPRIWPGIALAACGAAAALQPSTMALVHEALEALAH